MTLSRPLKILIGALTIWPIAYGFVFVGFVVLSFFAERDAAQIAEELGMTAGNVRVVRHRALQRVRGCLEGRT